MLHIVESKKPLEQVAKDLEEAVTRHKFGVLGVHDLKATMAKKGVAFARECRIFEVCNPHQAKKVLETNFETAAAALASVMVDPATLEITIEREITLTAAQLDLLLFDWLSELIFLKDRDRQVFPRAQVEVSGSGPYELRARVHGGVIDLERTALGADPKAVTFHQFALQRVDGGWRARVVIDI